MSETELMQLIKDRWGAEISAAGQASGTVQSFLAALIANESGGKNDALRFEPAVFIELKEVLLGTRPHYAPSGIRHPILKTDLLAYCDPGVGEQRGSFADSLQCLHNLATSWGLTQIMGWHVVEFQTGMGTAMLATPGGNLQFATRLLAWFAEHYGLDLANDFDALFHCWNAGDPSHPTYDPNYVANGLARKAIYEGLP
jgi:hypothetical protein